MTYGFRLTSMEAPDIKELNRNSHGFFGMVLQSKFLDWYPILRPLVKYVPLRMNPLARRAADFYVRERAHFRRLFLDVKTKKISTGSSPCKLAKFQRQEAFLRMQ